MAGTNALPTGMGVALVPIFGDDGPLDMDATTEHAMSCDHGAQRQLHHAHVSSMRETPTGLKPGRRP